MGLALEQALEQEPEQEWLAPARMAQVLMEWERVLAPEPSASARPVIDRACRPEYGR